MSAPTRVPLSPRLVVELDWVTSAIEPSVGSARVGWSSVPVTVTTML